MRMCKKEYYYTILQNNNIKGIWNVLNSVIRNGSKISNYPQY